MTDLPQSELTRITTATAYAMWRSRLTGLEKQHLEETERVQNDVDDNNEKGEL